MTFNDWHVYSRDPNGVRQGEIDDFIDLEMIPVWNDVGTWTMSLDSNAPQAANMLTPGWGMIAQRDGVIIMSGPVTSRTMQINPTTSRVTLAGSDDNIWLKRRVAHPVPTATAPPYSAQAADTRTGAASTVLIDYVDANLGPGAITTRRVSGLTMAADPAVGTTVTGEARWDDFLVFLQALALSGGVGFQIIQVGNGLQFQTMLPTNRAATIKFSIDLGNLTGFEYSATAPTANYVFVGGDGTLATRAINEFQDVDQVATWGRVEGSLVGSSGASGDPQLALDGNSALTSGGEQTSLNLTPVDIPSCLYGVHYFLGDTVTVALSKPIVTPYGVAGQVIDTIQSVNIKLSSAGGVVTSPLVASAPKKMITGLFRDFAAIRKRLNYLEKK